MTISSAPHVVQNNITDDMEQYKTFEFLEANKNRYSSSRFSQISEALTHQSENIRVVSFNILFDKGDSKLQPQNRWPTRKNALIEATKRMNADILGVQEPLDHQLVFLKEQLSDYHFFSGDRDGAGMRPGIFFKKDRFERIEEHSYRLQSDGKQYEHVTSDENWKKKYRILNHVKLRDTRTDKSIHVFNTHLSFKSADWREMEATAMHEITTRTLQEEQTQSGSESACIVMGDFNSFASRVDYPLPFLDGNNILQIMTKDTFKDAKDTALIGHTGPISTYTDSEIQPSKGGPLEKSTPFAGIGTPGIIVDHILVSKKITPIIHAINPVKVDGEYPSDHMPVIMDCIIKNN